MDKPIEFPVVLKYTTTRAEAMQLVEAIAVGCINSRPVFGYPAGSVICTKFSWWACENPKMVDITFMFEQLPDALPIKSQSDSVLTWSDIYNAFRMGLVTGPEEIKAANKRDARN